MLKTLSGSANASFGPRVTSVTDRYPSALVVLSGREDLDL